MTTVHTLAALAVAWLLHRADARMVAALDMLRTLAGAAAAALVQALPRPVTGRGVAAFGCPVGRCGTATTYRHGEEGRF